MTTAKIDVEVFHFEHKVWMDELDFFAGELKFFENRLSELVQRENAPTTYFARLEQFQNQFIRQKEVLDQLKRDIHVHEQSLSNSLQHGTESPVELTDVHQKARDRMVDFRRIYSELKQAFFQFATT
ncbi:MAG: hypothetical protein H6555_09845 [Lewinellaceae bacterium]|nr:hypothetical protein [Lewinellaceae bacterium]